MTKFKLLFVEDEKNQEELLKDAVEYFKDKGIIIEYDMVYSPEEATYKLYSNSYDGLIIDLKLRKGEEVENREEQLSGNKLINDILKKEFIPIIVRTGTPGNFELPDKEIQEGLIRVYAKDDKPFEELISELLIMDKSTLVNVFGTNGKLSETINNLFWKIIPQIKTLLNDEKALLRYISNYIAREYSYSVDDSSYLQQDPLEMYICIDDEKRICTGDIVVEKNTGKNYIVLTPACDLANRKTDNLLVAEITSYDEDSEFLIAVNGFMQKKDSIKKRKNVEKWFRNGNKNYLYFLPSIDKFEGGFVDFRKLISLSYKADDYEIGDKADSYTKKVGMTDPFVKELVARFSAYYQRQGQPELDSERVITSLPMVSENE